MALVSDALSMLEEHINRGTAASNGSQNPDLRWQRLAACRGMDVNMFFPGRGEKIPEGVAEACSSCPVIEECKTAGEREYFGIWGGMSERQRRRIRHAKVEVRRLTETEPLPRTSPALREEPRNDDEASPELSELEPAVAAAPEPELSELEPAVAAAPEPELERACGGSRKATSCGFCGSRLRGRQYCDRVCESAAERRPSPPPEPEPVRECRGSRKATSCGFCGSRLRGRQYCDRVCESAAAKQDP